MTYSRDVVERTLATVLGGQAPKLRERDRQAGRGCEHCDSGRDRCTHRCDLDQWGEGCISTFEGVEFGICRHVHNGRRRGRCGVCWCHCAGERKATKNKKHGSDAPAALADVSKAWEHTAMLQLHRRRIYLRYAMGWTVDQIADYENVNKSSVSRSITSTLDAMVAYLDG